MNEKPDSIMKKFLEKQIQRKKGKRLDKTSNNWFKRAKSEYNDWKYKEHKKVKTENNCKPGH